ncbi:MAG: polyprenyl diphosphate synthase, partial [Clostridia bacterium]|nr:polyprenyl diphosphate synthase [Clostridia bacterium]
MLLKDIKKLFPGKGPRETADFEKLPNHVAIIMDGNGRWAKKHKLSVSKGHRQGTETLREIIRHTDDLGIGSLSLYAFSTENWKRSPEEVAALMQLILDFFRSEIDELDAKNVRIRIMGDKGGLPEKQRDTLIEAERRTEKNSGLNLNIAVNYGSRAELVLAAKEIALEVKNGDLQLNAITEQTISDHLYTRGQPDVDFMIRTSGEMRLSNFMLY